mmetsp:Transcript_19237/g.26929  ORF Transcript_19237/g.26929 Transcript_19237/m.26929 type:complete len:132 (-) Transcript_19237:82-477(-)
MTNHFDPDYKKMTAIQKIFAPRRQHSKWFMWAQFIVPMGSAVLGILLTLKGIQEANKPKKQRDLEIRHNPHSQLVIDMQKVFEEASEKRRAKKREQKKLEESGVKLPENTLPKSPSAPIAVPASGQAQSCH